MIALKSNVPFWGRNRRTGARIGSVAWTRNRDTWLLRLGSNQDIRTRPRMSSQSPTSRIDTKFRTNTSTTIRL